MKTRRMLVASMLLVIWCIIVLGRGGVAQAEKGNGQQYQVFLPALHVNRPAAVPRYTLVGVVWADANGNGVQDVGETGVARIPIQLTTTPANPGPSPITGSLTVLTDAQGRFFLTVYEDNQYTLAALPDPNRWTATTATRHDFQAPLDRTAFNIGLQAR